MKVGGGGPPGTGHRGGGRWQLRPQLVDGAHWVRGERSSAERGSGSRGGGAGEGRGSGRGGRAERWGRNRAWEERQTGAPSEGQPWSKGSLSSPYPLDPHWVMNPVKTLWK